MMDCLPQIQRHRAGFGLVRQRRIFGLASKLVGWDIEIMTHDEYNDGIERAGIEERVEADPTPAPFGCRPSPCGALRRRDKP